MKTRASAAASASPCVAIHVAEAGVRTPKGSVRCEMRRHVEFSTASLESYFFARWEPVAYDALLIAAAVEFADVTQKRTAYSWQRGLEVRVPVHDPDRWTAKHVSEALHDVLAFLTGDRWHIEFYRRRRPENPPRQGLLSLNVAGVDAIIPFSNGLDSCVVAALMSRDMRLVRLRLGSTLADAEALSQQREAFTSVPYKVKPPKGARTESSARSRGFKFALISGIAAYLSNAARIVVPESGQGALGPALVTVGQAYEDYRSHPLFTARMEKFLDALFSHRVRYVFPQIWHTKGETLRIVSDSGDSSWASTWSCWQQNRHVSVDGKRRQCGICAACMLRRMSVHAAGLSEPRERYVWEDLSAPAFARGAAASFSKRKITRALRQYAIAGALHLDHLAGLLDSKANGGMLNLAASQLSSELELSQVDAREKLARLLRQHSNEWENFMLSLGPRSFVADWAVSARS